MLSTIGIRKTTGSNSDGLTRLTILVSDGIDARLRRLAARRGLKIATMIRPWIVEVLSREEKLDDDNRS